jgi:hypothetical protein
LLRMWAVNNHVLYHEDISYLNDHFGATAIEVTDEWPLIFEGDT